ncbi:hypothetical protein F5B18DRAFT_91296 [Nemania serpens]|nr:hypothetical protein F5B18DRAFT_91296 [Nemania serpens]
MFEVEMTTPMGLIYSRRKSRDVQQRLQQWSRRYNVPLTGATTGTREAARYLGIPGRPVACLACFSAHGLSNRAASASHSGSTASVYDRDPHATQTTRQLTWLGEPHGLQPFNPLISSVNPFCLSRLAGHKGPFFGPSRPFVPIYEFPWPLSCQNSLALVSVDPSYSYTPWLTWPVLVDLFDQDRETVSLFSRFKYPTKPPVKASLRYVHPIQVLSHLLLLPSLLFSYSLFRSFLLVQFQSLISLSISLFGWPPLDTGCRC